MSAPTLAFLGAGTMALRQGQAFLDAGLSPRAFATVFDRNPAAARAFADRFGAVPADSARGAIERASHVIIATSAGAHASDAFAALELRRAVFVEKPLALSVRDGAALTVLSERLGVSLHVGLSERFHPVVRALLAELDGRRAEHVVASRRVVAMRGRDCSIAQNLAVHDADLALLLTRTELRVDRSATAATPSAFRTRFVGEQSELVSLEATVGAAVPARIVTVVAGRVTYEADLLDGTLFRLSGGTATPLPVAGESGLVAQARAVIGAWSGQHPATLATARDAFRSLVLLARASHPGGARPRDRVEYLPAAAPFG